MRVGDHHYRTVWMEGSKVFLIDQPKLPHRFEITTTDHHRQTARAIKDMVVRGAGAIGATGAYGAAQAALEAPSDPHDFRIYFATAVELLRATRPTAQNLFYGIGRVSKAAMKELPDVSAAREAAVAAAGQVAEEDAGACRRIGEHGASLIGEGWGISTHCNAGWLAFVDWGSALSPVYAAHRRGQRPFVYVDETRPRGQGANLTAWELGGEGISHALIADNAAGHFMQRGAIQIVLVGSDRIARNGDVANKIGTYTHAVVAHEMGIPFYVAAPTTTIDPQCPSGDDIPIEERDADEVLYTIGRDDEGRIRRVRVAPDGCAARNPAFDVTPARYITGIITEHGVFPATPDGIARTLKARESAS